jgi:hypothetical protein
MLRSLAHVATGGSLWAGDCKGQPGVTIMRGVGLIGLTARQGSQESGESTGYQWRLKRSSAPKRSAGCRRLRLSAGCPANSLPGTRRMGSRSDNVTTKWATVAAVVAAALSAPAGAADLLPPATPRHLPHGPQAHPPVVPPGHVPRATIGLPNAEPAGSAIVGWGTNGTLMATPVAISTDPSGVIGALNSTPPINFLRTG